MAAQIMALAQMQAQAPMQAAAPALAQPVAGTVAIKSVA
jgi:hypothetical protein